MDIEWGSPEVQERVACSEFWQALQHGFAEFLAPPPQPAVLDIECGTGQLSLLWSGYAASVVGVDLSEEKLRRAEQHRLEREVPHVSFRVASPEALPFKDGAFDVVSAFYALAITREPSRAMQEMARVIRPGGVFGALVPSKCMNLERIDGFLAGEPDPVAAAALRMFHAARPEGFTERHLERLLIASGLRSVRTTELADGLLWIVKGWR